MDELVAQAVFFKAITEMTTNEICKYIPDSDTCIIYHMKNGRLAPVREIQAFHSVFYENTEESSHKTLEELFECIRSRTDKASFELKLKKKNWRKSRWVTCYLKYETEGDYYIGFLKEIDERVNENQKLYEEARKDSLTKLINKAYSTQLIQDFIEKKTAGALCIIDIDNFKSVNDTMGHLFGDEVIVSVANGIKSVFRQTDVVGRIGGDEFIVYMENITDRDIISKKAETVCDTVSNIYTGESEKVKISASVGIAVFPEDAEDYSELFKMADHALYFTKNKGKNGFSFFDKNNEEMQKNHRIAVKKDDLREEAEEINEEMDSFYFELNELAFRLLQDMKDADSAIHLLLHKLQDKFGFSSIRILEPEKAEREFTCTYELCSGNLHRELGQRYSYTEPEWIRLNSFCGAQAHAYKKSEDDSLNRDLFKSKDSIKSGVIVSISYNGYFSGVILFADSLREREFSKKELKVLKSFENIYSVYKTRKDSIANTDFYLRQLTERDNLTGLYKYPKFIEKLEESIYSVTPDYKLLYLYADIAYFKYINESYGYDVGDRLLKCFADLLCGSSPYMLYAGRVHSDNNVVVYKIPASISDQEIINYINILLPEKNAVLQSIIDSENFYINCGVYIAKSGDSKYDRGITNANYARKLARDNRDGRCVWYDDKMFEEQKKKMQLMDDFAAALRLHEFEIYYQPQIDTISKTIVGAEALSRWVKEDGSIMKPEEFVGVLEHANRLAELDFYVINQVFDFIRRQRKRYLEIVPISINLTKRHIVEENFFDQLNELMKKYEIREKDFLFEIKEEVFKEDFDAAVLFCGRLKFMGIRVMMDSFGNGCSSLNVMDKIPVDYIKLDRLFIKNNIFTKNEEIILNGIVDIAKKLQKSIASIGVETLKQNEFLCRCGCDIVQGNYYSEPLTEEKLIAYIAAHSEPALHYAHFAFDGSFASNEKCYTANTNGVYIGFNDKQLEGRKVLELPGGLTGHDVIELSLGNLLANDFTVSMWFNSREEHIWSSLFYADFENGFFSLIPKAWNGLSVMRVMDKSEEMGYYDAISTEKNISGWTYIAAAYNSGSHSSAIFINGFLTGYKNNVISLKNPGRVILGGDIYQPSFNGFVADLKVINKTLSAKDVREEYERSRQKYRKK